MLLFASLLALHIVSFLLFTIVSHISVSFSLLSCSWMKHGVFSTVVDMKSPVFDLSVWAICVALQVCVSSS